MQELIMYKYIDENGETQTTFEPMDKTSAQMFYLLIADNGHYLENTRYNTQRYSATVPQHLKKYWVEKEIKKKDE